MCSREAPLLLGQICSEWRQIAYSTPELWSSIHIVVPTVPWNPDIDQYALGPPIHTISDWLSRSGVLPVSISMTSTSNIKTSPRMNIKAQKYMEAIIPFSQRWRSLKLNFGGYDWRTLFSRLSVEDVPMLERLHIGGRFLTSRRRYDYSSITRKQSIICAPRLCRISLPAFGGEILHFLINWQRLTSLDLFYGDMGFRHTIEMLSGCPNLEACSLPCEKAYDGFASTAINIESLKLVSLLKLISLKFICKFDIYSDSLSYLIYFLRILHTPNLRHLSFGEVSGFLATYEELDDFPVALSLFKNRLVVPLEELRLDAFWLTREQVEGILKVFPEVKRLSLEIPSNPVQGPRSPMDIYRRGGHYGYQRPLTPNQFVWDDKQLKMFMDNQIHGCSGANIHQDDSLLPPSLNIEKEMMCDSPESKYLCPNLEVLYCTGAVFSTDVLFNFLRFRRSSTSTLLQKASTSFSPEYVLSIPMPLFRKYVERIEEETGLLLGVQFPPNLLKWEQEQNHNHNTCSPYDGLQNGNEVSRWTSATRSGNTKMPIYFGF